jgi:hypothetical protein
VTIATWFVSRVTHFALGTGMPEAEADIMEDDMADDMELGL